MTDRKQLFVTRPALPPLADFLPLLEEIWGSHWLTNAGPYHQRFEQALGSFLGSAQPSLFSNGTLALVTALQALRVTGEVVTTPFSFVATAHALLWNGIRPVFVDIEEETLNLDPKLIEQAITPQTTAVLPVHVYGRPCAVRAIQTIADTYGLRVIYDAAHTFGARFQGESLAQFGDVSILSFHATKVFTTFEGGATVTKDPRLKQRIDYLKNFGFADETTVVAPGINGKMNEFQAALGLLQLNHVQKYISQREAIDRRYREALAGIDGIRCLAPINGAEANFGYFPILVDPSFGKTRDALFTHLRAQDIVARRYFYPLISEFPMYRGLPSAAPAKLPVATRIARSVLCLPIYPDIGLDEADRVAETIRIYRTAQES